MVNGLVPIERFSTLLYVKLNKLQSYHFFFVFNKNSKHLCRHFAFFFLFVSHSSADGIYISQHLQAPSLGTHRPFRTILILCGIDWKVKNWLKVKNILNLWIFNILLFLITIPIALDPIASFFLHVLASLTSTCKSYPLLIVVLSYTPVLMSFLFSGLRLAYLPRSTLRVTGCYLH